MANIKSQIERIKTNEKARVRNSSFKAATRTAIKAVKVAVEAKNKEEAVKLLPNAESMIDASVGKGILHKNAASRQKSNLSKLVNSL